MLIKFGGRKYDMKRRNFLTRLVLGIVAIPAAIKGFGKSTDYNVGIANCVWRDGRKREDKHSQILWKASDPKAYCGKDIDIYKIDEMGKIL